MYILLPSVEFSCPKWKRKDPYRAELKSTQCVYRRRNITRHIKRMWRERIAGWLIRSWRDVDLCVSLILVWYINRNERIGAVTFSRTWVKSFQFRRNEAGRLIRNHECTVRTPRDISVAVWVYRYDSQIHQNWGRPIGIGIARCGNISHAVTHHDVNSILYRVLVCFFWLVQRFSVLTFILVHSRDWPRNWVGNGSHNFSAYYLSLLWIEASNTHL
jgi:hypothetical protein